MNKEKNSYDFIEEAVREYWYKTYPQDVVAFFYQKYKHETDDEWEFMYELIECQNSGDYENMIFHNDFCEGQTCVKGIVIIPLNEVLEYYARDVLWY